MVTVEINFPYSSNYDEIFRQKLNCLILSWDNEKARDLRLLLE